jgi:hypothetical protein
MKIRIHTRKAVSQTWKQEFLICAPTMIIKAVFNVTERRIIPQNYSIFQDTGQMAKYIVLQSVSVTDMTHRSNYVTCCT